MLCAQPTLLYVVAFTRRTFWFKECRQPPCPSDAISSDPFPLAMDHPDQATLKKPWTSGRHGTLCPMELMKAWGIAWAMKHHYKDDVN